MTFDPHDVIEFWTERSAVIEFMGNLPRLNAESMALREVSQRWGVEAARLVSRHREGMVNG